MREKIEEKLKEIDPVVDYGLGKFKSRPTWDCIIFRKKNFKKEKLQSKDYYTVAVVREDSIPEGFEERVIKKMAEIGFKPTESNSTEYIYVFKSNEIVVESCFMEFVKTTKGCG